MLLTALVAACGGNQEKPPSADAGVIERLQGEPFQEVMAVALPSLRLEMGEGGLTVAEKVRADTLAGDDCCAVDPRIARHFDKRMRDAAAAGDLPEMVALSRPSSSCRGQRASGCQAWTFRPGCSWPW